MRKRRSPLHNQIHASNIKKRPYDNAPPPTTPSAHTSPGTYLPLQLYHRRLANHTNALFSLFYLPHAGLSLNNPGFAPRFSASSTMETNLSEEYFPSFLSSSVGAQSLLPSCHISCFLVNTIFPLLSFITAGSSNTSCRFSGIKHITLLFDGPCVGISTSRPL